MGSAVVQYLFLMNNMKPAGFEDISRHPTVDTFTVNMVQIWPGLVITQVNDQPFSANSRMVELSSIYNVSIS